MIKTTTYLTLLLLLYASLASGQAPNANFTASVTSGCSPLVVSFSDISTGNPTSWFWDFGNGGTSNLKNPSTTYFNPGVYNVRLVATNAAGSTVMNKTGFITIYSKPSVKFKASDTLDCFPFEVQFTDTSVASPGTTNVDWLWDFGDGSQSTLQNPSHTFNGSGNYTISLKITNDKGCFAFLSKQGYIKTTVELQANFNQTLTNRCDPPFPVQFTNTTTGAGTITYNWQFGDNTSSTATNPLHIYNTNGNFTVKLIATNNLGCTDTVTKTGLFNFPVINTGINGPDSICINTPANFTSTSSPQPLSYNWIFGNGDTGNSAAESTSFPLAQSYTVTLYTTYANCSDSAKRIIKVLPRPKSIFNTPDSFNCKPPYTVAFQNSSTGAVSYQWFFGDGNGSTQANPTHTYTSYGNFTVTLVTTNSSGCTDTLVKPAFIKIKKPVISFIGFPKKGCVPFTTTFNATVSTLDNVTSWQWGFGDGTFSNAISPSHNYPLQGNYTTTLTITTSTGCTITDSLVSGVKVGRKPQVQFTAAPNPVCAFAPIQFTDLSNEADGWTWDFGDGNFSNAQNPNYQYSDTGLFTVTLISENNGCKDTLTKINYVRVKAPIARFYIIPNCSNRLQFIFKDSSIGATTWSWNFGDGNTSTAQDPVHQYAAYGTYTVTLTVTNDSCSHTVQQIVRAVNQNPDFTFTPIAACKPAPVSFTTTNIDPTAITNYNWDFGDGNGSNSSAQNISHTYTVSGDFNIRLITTDIHGCQDTAGPKPIRINGPVAQFTGTNLSGCKGLASTFTQTSTSDGVNPITNFTWRFGDGTSLTNTTGASVQHVYPNPGTYTVTLIVRDSKGCFDSLVRTNYIIRSDPNADFVADTLACPGSTVGFNNLSSGSNATSSWSFGDNSFSTAHFPTKSYADTGKYTIRLIVTDEYGCSDTMIKPQYIKVYRPKASFTVSDSISSCAPFEVIMNNTSTYINAWSWNLAGSPSGAYHPTQYFFTPGIFTIKLYVSSPGNCIDSTSKTVRLVDTAGTRLTYIPLSGCNPLEVTLFAQSNGFLDYTWDFGDGVILNYNSDTLKHTYNYFGNFVPKIIMTDSSGCVIPVTGPDTIRIIGAVAKFGLDRELFCDSGTVSILDSTTWNDPIVSYNWDFGDGGTSTVQQPTYTYTTPGLYTVTLSILTQNGCVDTFRKVQSIRVVESPSAAVGGDSVVCLNELMTHIGVLLKPDTSLVKWSWNFPNNNTSILQNPPQQQYGTAGTFLVTTVAVNSSGCRDTATRSILVNPLPQVNMPASMVKQTGTPLTIPAHYTSNVITWNWTPAGSLNCATCAQPVTSTKFNTKYAVAFVDSNGCKNNGQTEIIVFCPNANVFLPNTFSPNGDGSNDVFYVRGKGLERVKTLRIFNRWGEIVFESSNFAANDAMYGWNGKYKGAPALPDVYVYQVEVFCENSQIIKYEGNVALVR